MLLLFLPSLQMAGSGSSSHRAFALGLTYIIPFSSSSFGSPVLLSLSTSPRSPPLSVLFRPIVTSPFRYPDMLHYYPVSSFLDVTWYFLSLLLFLLMLAHHFPSTIFH